MHPMDQRITVWARSVSADARRNGPTLTDLGGKDEVLAAAAYFTNGPFLDHLVLALAHQLEHEPGDEAELHDLLLAGLAATTQHAAFACAVDALTHRPALTRALGVRLTKILLRRLTDAQDAGDDPAAALIGAEAADFLVQLALSQTISPARLLGAMDEVTEDPAVLPVEFAARLPRLLGVLDAHHPAAGLYEALERCLPFDHLFRDAAFELALADIRTALQQRDYATMADRLRNCRQRFTDLTAVDPDRIDAQIYRAGIDGLLGLSAPDGPQRVAAAADTLRKNLQRYRSWRMRTTTPSWASGRQDDITAWAQLTTLLDQAARHIGHDDPWYGDGHDILTALLAAYTAHHTVLVLTDTPAMPVVETLVAPVIEDTFLQQENRKRTLEYALTHEEDLRDDPAAQRLYAALSVRSTAPSGSDPALPPADRGKERRWRQLARQLPDYFPILANQTPDDVLDKLELALRDSDDFASSIADPKYVRLMNGLITRLQTSLDWIPGIAEPFQSLLDATIRYAYLCYDIGRKMGGGYTEYLRLRNKDGKKQKVDEALFHQHYREVLTFSALFRQVHSEVIDKGGGRADILFTFNTAQFNVECKIEEDDASETGLRIYVAQAAEYQNTSAAFAILLALDKTVAAEGAINLFDSIWIETVQRPGETTPCHVIIVRVPGGRDNPNLLRPGP